ncbi:MAG: type II toxin-antitoxin system RelE/ParE family toxin [Duodenibacillus sp.]|nr:type II toxin-antitoxin system RelE/ParE family toxin [Duodenibacillus sp.]
MVETTSIFDAWHCSLRDKVAKIAIARRLERAEHGNFGDHKAIREGVSEMRVSIGAGYRLYYTIRDRQIIFLLCGGDKASQKSDIEQAIKIAKEL